MKSYKELLLEMLKPLSGNQMLKKIQRKYPDSFIQDSNFNETANTIVIRCTDDDLAREEFFGDDEEENERRLYATVVDPIIATVLNDVDYDKVKTQR